MRMVWKNVTWLMTGQLFSRLIKGVLVILAARILGAEHFGSFNLALSIAATFMLLNDWGLDMLAMREAAKGESKNNAYITSLFIVKTSLLVLSALGILILGPLFATSYLTKRLLPIIGTSTLLDALRDFHLSLARAKNRMDIDARNNVTVNAIITFFGITSLVLHPSVFLLAYAYLLGSFFGLLLTLFDVQTYYHAFRTHLSAPLLQRVVQEGIPLGLTVICITVLLYADNIMIGFFLDEKSVGLYAAPMKLIQLLYVGAGIIATSYLPLMSQHITASPKKFQEIVASSILFSSLAGVGITAVMFFLAPILIPVFFGGGYPGSLKVFQVLVASVPFVYVSTTLGHILLVLNRQNAMIPFLVLGTTLNLLLNAIFIGKLGIEGAAIANVVAQTVNFTGYFVVYLKYKLKS